uniref:SGS domain-containing protein n=1 Tax=Elaeophora elaphi TaxID=1147741 RepID=A0A0R3S309_9BILA
MFFRYDFYQTETHVFVTILKRGLTLEQCKAHYMDGCLTVIAAGETLLNIRLSHLINPASLELKCSTSKIELKMAKATSDQWETLEEKSEENKNKPALISWDKFAKEVEDEDEKGDVNILFQASSFKLYKDADDDTRKAMVKSYTESGGTVLSTNWNEISKKRTEIRPPDGMEFKKW